MTKKLLKLLPLYAAAAWLAYGQGLTTNATKDDWEEINFERGSAILVDGYPSLLRLADLLRQNPSFRARLEGHGDDGGSDKQNETLGMKRAETVKSFLVKYGANDNQISTGSRGRRDRKADSRTPEGRFMNRRVTMTVTDGQGKVVSAGGIGDAIRGMQGKGIGEECCDAILKRLDKLDEIANMLRDLKGENAALRKELDDLKGQQDALKTQVAGLPKPLTSGEVNDITNKAATSAVTDALQKERIPRFSLLGVNAGVDDEGRLTFSGRGRFFAPFRENFAVQAQGEYMYFRDRQEGQFDLGLVSRVSRVQAGLFASFKNVYIREFGNNGTLGQGAFTFDYLFNRGKVGVFGTKGFLNEAILQSVSLTRTITLENYLRVVDQVGASATLGLYKNVYAEGNIGYLKSRGHADRPGGALRFVFPISDRWAFTVEGDVNPTLLGRDNSGRVVAGVQWGNFLRPKEYLMTDRPVPVDVPRVRYELLTRRVRNGNDAPIADAGVDQIGVQAGQITLDGSKSFDPEGDPITFQWTQIAGPAVSLAGANTATATFTAAEGQNYAFRLQVTDDKGASSLARVQVSTARAAQVRILRFTATPAQITVGQTSTLRWDVENAETVTIDGIGNVDPRSGNTNVSPQTTTQYRLTARNRQGEVSETITVQVQRQDVRIVFFSASPMTVQAGGQSTLSWVTENADQVTITGLGTVAQQGNAVVTVNATTTYVLTARGQTGQTTSAQVTIQATAQPAARVVRFTANPAEILEGEQSSLVWQVEGATDVSISDVGPVSLTGSTEVRPTTTTTYTLTARNQTGEVTAEATVTVIPTARITSFTATPTRAASPGSPVTLAWTTQNATEASIDGIGRVPANGNIVVRPQSETTYTLRVFGRRSQDTATVTVTVTPEVPGGGPVADAGPDQVTTNREIRLDGSRSISPEGLVIGFSWRAVGRQPELILGADTSTPTVRFAPLAFGEYTFELTVTDSRGRFARDTVKVFFAGY